MAKLKLPRSRIVTIARIYDTPKLKSEQEDYNYYSLGIKMEDETYANISVSAADEEEAMRKAEKKMIIDQETGDKIQEGGTYEVFEESSDAEHKYWNVVAFVPAKKSKVDYSGAVDSTPDPYGKMRDDELAKVQKEVAGVAQKAAPSTSVPEAQSNYAAREKEKQLMEKEKQLMIVRQSAINYATQLESVFLVWELKEDEGIAKDPNMLYDRSVARIKKTAKEYEELVMRK